MINSGLVFAVINFHNICYETVNTVTAIALNASNNAGPVYA